MFDWNLALQALLVLLAMAFLSWLASLVRRDVSIVDSVWPLFFFLAFVTFRASALPN
jgi:steroid 5-alpha reductase family enzyme